MAFLLVDLPAHADDSTAAASVMFRLTTQLLQPTTVESGKRQPRRALQRVVPATAVPRQPHRTAQTATSAATPAPPLNNPGASVWTGLTARPRDTGRVSLESVWWTAQSPYP